MSIVESIINCFGVIVPKSIAENTTIYKEEFLFSNTLDLELLRIDIPPLLSQLSAADIDFFIRINGLSEQITLRSSQLCSVESSLNKLDEYLEYGPDDVNVELWVEKENSNVINVFRYEKFVADLLAYNLEESFGLWSDYNVAESLSINVWESAESLITNFFKVSSVYENGQYIPHQQGVINALSERKKIMINRESCGHFSNASNFNFLPEDFILEESSESNLGMYFNGLANAMLVIFLADYSNIEIDELKYRLNGYKLISGVISAGDLNTVINSELLNIYRWTYLDGNFTDKIGISRNIISIHLVNESILSLEDGTQDSVRSGYDLYLKENVKQYIEVKNKISEFLHGQSDKALDITKNMFSMFKTGLWTYSTFFISIFLLRVVNKGQLSGAVSFEVLIVSLLLIGVSFIYLCISISEVNSDKERLFSRYDDIEERYQYLLDKKDLDKIINLVNVKRTEGQYIDEKRNGYVLVWIATNVLVAITVLILYCFGGESSPENKSLSAISKESQLFISQLTESEVEVISMILNDSRVHTSQNNNQNNSQAAKDQAAKDQAVHLIDNQTLH
jgi:hypothetical protein